MSLKSQNEEQPNASNRAIMVFSRPLVRHLSTLQGRLEPTYVGVKRIRPSSRMVKEVFDQEKKKNNTDEPNLPRRSPHVFKVMGEDGTERRMTKQEKRAMKHQIAQQKKLEKQQRLLEKEKNEALNKKKRKRKHERTGPVLAKNPKQEKESAGHENENENPTTGEQNDVKDATDPIDNSKTEESTTLNGDDDEDEIKGLAQVGMPPQNLSALELELADLRGERNGIPPVLLAAPLAQAALRTPGFLPGNTQSSLSSSSIQYSIDDQLAQEWATAIQQSMLPALEVRSREAMRSMAYDIIPEVWSRLRPDALRISEPTAGTEEESKGETNEATATTTTTTNVRNRDPPEGPAAESWGLVSIRPPSTSTFDSDLAAVAEVLYRNSPLYLSCGAKFGCDMLLYDGPRQERHAFAGLRVVVNETSSASEDQTSFPIPSAYAVAGYVRTLNTAGKLAMLALVRRDTTTTDDGSTTKVRVALADLKLQRVDGTKRKDNDERLEKLNRTA